MEGVLIKARKNAGKAFYFTTASNKNCRVDSEKLVERDQRSTAHEYCKNRTPSAPRIKTASTTFCH